MFKYMLYVIVATSTLIEINSKPQDAVTPSGDAAASSSTDPATSPSAGAGDATAAGAADTDATTPAGQDQTDSGGDNGTTVEQAVLTLGPDDITPENVFTDRYGQALSTNEIVNFTLLKGAGVQLLSEHWWTYYTRPATKPGCICLTRGPLPRFKLIGNIHFPKIKVTAGRYVTVPTEATTTLCPPCDCSSCPPHPMYGS